MPLAERAVLQADGATERVDIKTIYNTLCKLKGMWIVLCKVQICNFQVTHPGCVEYNQRHFSAHNHPVNSTLYGFKIYCIKYHI